MFGKNLISAALIAALAFPGCSFRDKVLPAHNEVLIYPLAYDLTYLRTLEALETLPEWELEETEKENGIIRARNINYSQFGDADKRLATFLVKRISRNETSVQLAPGSERVAGGDKLLERIARYVSREL